MDMRTGKVAAAMLGLALVLYAIFALTSPKVGEFGSAHGHADFKLYINGQEWNFSREKYMSEGAGGDEENCTFGETLAHLHNMDGEVVHKHATGVTWGYFFSTLNISFEPGCLLMDDGSGYCSGDGRRLRYFVNGLEVSGIRDYEIRDLDRVLITYGSESEVEIERQIASVTNKSAEESSGIACAG